MTAQEERAKERLDELLSDLSDLAEWPCETVGAYESCDQNDPQCAPCCLRRAYSKYYMTPERDDG